ncbi:uncharacterized protein LOC133883246 isoform X2 [Phragmites australis]|uniref:uncharacterized protein LOC133883246 isoform X2 n=1 Tax=Phragmites australis TaxID=29695 RepID=UPI002D78537D|nr:uncharacterized protein LOC133883246 isoform X2 [Phragmites australis]
MTLKSSRCSKRIYREPLLYRKKEFKSSVIKFVDSSLNSNSLPTNNICSTPASEDGCHLIKRRMDEEYNSLLTNGNMRETTTRSFTASEYNSSLVQNSDGESLMVSSSVEISNSGANTVEYTRDYEEHAEASVRNFLTNSAGSNSNVDNGQPSSTSSMPPYINHRIKDAWEGSSSDANAAKPVTELTSARDICISILKRDIFPTKDSEPRRQSTTTAPDDNEISPLFECMRCGSMEDPSKMLICDYCEGAFHLSCCNPRVKKIPEEEWYCMVCERKKPKRQHEKLMSPQRELPMHIQRPRRGLRAIEVMLVDSEPYETEVRIGRDFQAEVPEWSGPISSNEDQFAEPSELDPSEMTMLGRLQIFKDKKNSVGNWIQCREVLDTGVVCGKWRRAPLFVVQSRDWDCSCSVIWDPIHADCAVPQELETDEVLKQLTYITKILSTDYRGTYR